MERIWNIPSFELKPSCSNFSAMFMLEVEFYFWFDGIIFYRIPRFGKFVSVDIIWVRQTINISLERFISASSSGPLGLMTHVVAGVLLREKSLWRYDRRVTFLMNTSSCHSTGPPLISLARSSIQYL